MPEDEEEEMDEDWLAEEEAASDRSGRPKVHVPPYQFMMFGTRDYTKAVEEM